MHRTGNYAVTPRNRYEERGRRRERSISNTTEFYAMNFIATLLALSALAMFVVGMLIGTGVTDTSNTDAVTSGSFSGTNFAHGAIWLLGAIAVALAANVFRRSHSLIDPNVLENRSGYTER